ncbi:MAG: aminoacyl-tRNA hydrolase [Pseudomonadota bacterium]
MQLILGLGNPGVQYAHNRHNVGFLVIDAIHERHGFSPWRSRFSAEVSEGRVGSEKVILAKPTTYMNLSGQAAGEIARFYKLETADVTVIHDELDLDPGRTRIKVGGGHGGHNGLKSLDAHLGKDYRRIRVGIGHPGHKDLVSGYVLKDFAKADQPWVEAVCEELARSINLIFDGKDGDLNGRLNEATAPFRAQPEDAKTSASRSDANPRQAEKTKNKGQSHIRQARNGPAAKVPTKGPMADMLRKLLGGKGSLGDKG